MTEEAKKELKNIFSTEASAEHFYHVYNNYLGLHIPFNILTDEIKKAWGVVAKCAYVHFLSKFIKENNNELWERLMEENNNDELEVIKKFIDIEGEYEDEEEQEMIRDDTTKFSDVSTDIE